MKSTARDLPTAHRFVAHNGSLVNAATDVVVATQETCEWTLLVQRSSPEEMFFTFAHTTCYIRKATTIVRCSLTKFYGSHKSLAKKYLRLCSPVLSARAGRVRMLAAY